MLGRLHDAVVAYEQVLVDLEKIGRDRTADSLTPRQNLGVFLSKGGQTLKAIEVYRQALDVSRTIEDQEDVQPRLQINYAKALTDAGFAGEALPLFDLAINTSKRRGSKNSLALAELMAGAANCQLGRVANCGELLARARADLAAVKPPTDTMFGTLLLREAEFAELSGRSEAARLDLEQAMQVFLGAKERNPMAIRVLASLARLEQRQAQPARAKEHAEQALIWAREASAGFDRSAWLGIASLAQAVVLRGQNDPAGAASAVATALPHLVASLGEAAPETREAHQLATELKVQPPARTAMDFRWTPEK
jgi:tetratricopeptide (TPR) repeat protein